MRYSVEVGVLGPLTLSLGGKECAPTARKQRQLFALLLVHDSRVVSVPTVIEELWETPPRSAVTIVQTYVLAIRKQMAKLMGVSQVYIVEELLQTRARGYAFNTSACTFDLHRYLELTERGRAALSAGQDDTAIRLLGAAEQLWRGDALMDVECGLPLAAEAARLDQIRLANLERRIEAQLRRERYRDAVIDLTALVLRHPLHEKLHAYLMFGLSLSGWRSRALQVYIDLRRAMADELGLEPCFRLQRLHQDILRSSDDVVGALLERNHAKYLTGLAGVDAGPGRHVKLA